MLIGITQRVSFLPDRNERQDALDQAWTLFLKECGLEPVPIPNRHPCPVEFVQKLKVKGIILSGGNDFSPTVHTLTNSKVIQYPSVTETAPERDRTEIDLLKAAPHNNWPVFGVCRGMELLNIFYGGTLSAVEGHVVSRHLLTPTDASQKAFTPKFENSVNSFHNFGITTGELSPHLEILAVSGNVVEACRHTKHKQLGIMWHPERNNPFSPKDIAMFRKFFIQHL